MCREQGAEHCHTGNVTLFPEWCRDGSAYINVRKGLEDHYGVIKGLDFHFLFVLSTRNIYYFYNKEEGGKAKPFFFNIPVDEMPTYVRPMELLDVSFKTLSTLQPPDPPTPRADPQLTISAPLCPSESLGPQVISG